MSTWNSLSENVKFQKEFFSSLKTELEKNVKLWLFVFFQLQIGANIFLPTWKPKFIFFEANVFNRFPDDLFDGNDF